MGCEITSTDDYSVTRCRTWRDISGEVGALTRTICEARREEWMIANALIRKLEKRVLELEI